jgi:zinc protease
MKQWTLIIVLTLVISGCTPVNPTIFPYDARLEVLPNGLTIIMIPMESPGLVAYYSIVRTGSRDEVEQGKSGFAHFFEHMMFRGTKTYPGPVYDSLMTSIGASTNAYTTDDYTAYHLNFAREDLELVIRLEADRFQNLSYERAAFQTEAGAVYGEYRKSITDPSMLLYEAVQNLAYDVHPYKHTVIGFEQDIRAMPEGYDYSLSFFHRFYRPDNVLLMVVGDIDTGQTLETLRRSYGSWKPGYQAPDVTEEPPQKAERSGAVSYPGKTLPILTLAYKGAAFDPGNRSYVAALLLSELAFGETSELYRRLYIQEQAVEDLSSSVPMNRDRPLFEITATVKREEDLPAVQKEIEQTLLRFQQELPDPSTLAEVKRHNKYRFLMNLDTPNKVAGGLARLVAISGGIEAVDRLYDAMDDITAEDIRTAARTYYRPERRTVVVLKGAGS